MDQKTHSQKYLRHRKFLLVLPLLVLPFVAMIFWSMGGGKGNAASAEGLPISKGLNTQLPEAVIKDDQSLTKMSFYDRAASDSFKRNELIKTDPFFKLNSSTEAIAGLQMDSLAKLHSGVAATSLLTGGKISELAYNIPGNRDANEAKVYSKLAELNKAMNQASSQTTGNTVTNDSYSRPATPSVKSADVDRLEQMMNVMKSGTGGEDQEMKQLSSMLDKIMDIQHPEKVPEQVRQTVLDQGAHVLPVSTGSNKNNISLLEKAASRVIYNSYRRDTLIDGLQNGFHSLDSTENATQQQNTIPAVIHETQNLVSGATVKIRLGTDVYIKGVLVPSGNFVYGTAVISDERLKITIESIRYQNSIFPVKLSVYDMDGMEGIFIPGSISRDVAKSSTDQALQGVGLSPFSSSISAQAAGAGIQVAKTLLSKKAKLIKVSVKAGYQVLLKDAE